METVTQVSAIPSISDTFIVDLCAMQTLRNRIYRTLGFVFLLGLLSLGFVRPAFAIINIEALRIALQNQESVGVVAFVHDRKTGNTDINRFKITGQGMWRKGEFENLASIEREFGSSNNVRDTNKTTSHLRTNWLFRNPVSYEAFGQLEDDQFRRFRMRALLGAGLRYKLADEEKFKAFGGTGAFWSRETLDYAPNTTDAGTLDVNRANLYLSFNWLVMPEIELNGIVYYQPSIVAFADTRVFGTGQAVLHVNQLISVSFNYMLSYDTEPPELVKGADQTYSTALNFKF